MPSPSLHRRSRLRLILPSVSQPTLSVKRNLSHTRRHLLLTVQLRRTKGEGEDKDKDEGLAFACLPLCVCTPVKVIHIFGIAYFCAQHFGIFTCVAINFLLRRVPNWRRRIISCHGCCQAISCRTLTSLPRCQPVIVCVCGLHKSMIECYLMWILKLFNLAVM